MDKHKCAIMSTAVTFVPAKTGKWYKYTLIRDLLNAYRPFLDFRPCPSQNFLPSTTALAPDVPDGPWSCNPKLKQFRLKKNFLSVKVQVLGFYLPKSTNILLQRLQEKKSLLWMRSQYGGEKEQQVLLIKIIRAILVSGAKRVLGLHERRISITVCLFLC